MYILLSKYNYIVINYNIIYQLPCLILFYYTYNTNITDIRIMFLLLSLVIGQFSIILSFISK